MTKELAELYDEFIQIKGYRANSLRLDLLRVLVELTEPSDSKYISEQLRQKGYTLTAEEVRLQLKRLTNTGVLLRFPQEGKNKLLIQLRPFNELQEERNDHFNPRNTSFT